MLSNELRDQQEGKATRWAAFFDFQRAVAPCLNGCLFPTALISSCLNCRSLGGAEIYLVSKRMFIPDGTPVLVTEYYILTQRNIETLNMVVCSATNVESCLCLKAPREFLTPIYGCHFRMRYLLADTGVAEKNECSLDGSVYCVHSI